MALEQLLRSCGMPAGRSSGTGNGDGSSVVDALTVIPTTVIELRAAVDVRRMLVSSGGGGGGSELV